MILLGAWSLMDVCRTGNAQRHDLKVEGRSIKIDMYQK
jgi:hypothetical protein